MSTLGTRFDPRRNSLDALRLGLAALVAVAHSIAMRTGDQPQWGRSTLGDFAVDGFFILSGFLVTRSYLRLDSPVRFAWHRFLRIMPGFWVCLLLTALVVAPLAALLDGSPVTAPFTTEPTAVRYVVSNFALLINNYGIGELFSGTPNGGVVNGSLWTLVFEAFCYFLIGVLGLLGVLRVRPVLVPVIAGVVWVLSIGYELGIEVGLGDDLLRMVFLFFLGASAYLYADRLPMSGWLALGAAVLFCVSVGLLDNYRTLGAVPFAYALLWLSACLPPLSLRADLSYGLYIYHWPLLQLMASTSLLRLPQVAFTAVGLIGAAAIAAASWFLVEKPALSHKNDPLPNRAQQLLERRATQAGHRR